MKRNTRTVIVSPVILACSVYHADTIEKGVRELEIYPEREMRLLESDFDKVIKLLKQDNGEKDREN